MRSKGVVYMRICFFLLLFGSSDGTGRRRYILSFLRKERDVNSRDDGKEKNL